MAIVVVVLALAAYAAGAAFRTLPVDEIPLEAAVGFALWVGLIAITFGALALALSGSSDGGAAGIRRYPFAGTHVDYQATMEGFPPIARPHPVGLDARPSRAGRASTTGRRCSCRSSRPGALLAVGVEAFVRRDLGAMTALPVPGLPEFTLGTHEPIGRSLGDRLPIALALGARGAAPSGLMLAGISQVIADTFGRCSGPPRHVQPDLPDVRIGTAGGFLQLWSRSCTSSWVCGRDADRRLGLR